MKGPKLLILCHSKIEEDHILHYKILNIDTRNINDKTTYKEIFRETEYQKWLDVRVGITLMCL